MSIAARRARRCCSHPPQRVTTDHYPTLYQTRRRTRWINEQQLSIPHYQNIILVMVASWVSTAASIGMAVGPPLVYADQAISIVRKKYPSRNHFEIALLIQSILMILAQLALLYICILYRPRISPETLNSSKRPLSFWQWPTYTQYIEFLAGLMYIQPFNLLCQAILFLIFGRSETFVGILGFVALGLESTLPIPQLIRSAELTLFIAIINNGRCTDSACRLLLAGSVEILSSSPLQFKVCAIFQLSIDVAILFQRFMYGNSAPMSVLLEEDDELEQALALAED
ncbi:hypothetical protein B0H34DRAFT_674064 [Crassisporium funariophilum]|nr:hypothetical protein B0H34DRAFT_674064 [Crassisporium funariophilum]